MTPEQLRRMTRDELLELLQSALNVARHMSLVEDPRVHGAGENGPLMAIGDLEIWPRGEPGSRMARLADLTRVLEAKSKEKDTALLSALAGVWDGYYSGKGVTVEYARAVDREVKKAISGDLAKTIPQVRCEQCGISHLSQMEVRGPEAFRVDSGEKHFCSIRCFAFWASHWLDERDEARATAS